MVIFGVCKGSLKSLDKYVLEVKGRLEQPVFFKNPFIGGVVSNKGLWIINIKPLYPNFSIYGLLGFIVTFVVTNFKLSWWLLPSLIIFGLGFFWSGLFFRLMFKLGLRKKGIRTKIYYESEILEKVFFE